jgi:hypothetical protein
MNSQPPFGPSGSNFLCETHQRLKRGVFRSLQELNDVPSTASSTTPMQSQSRSTPAIMMLIGDCTSTRLSIRMREITVRDKRCVVGERVRITWQRIPGFQSDPVSYATPFCGIANAARRWDIAEFNRGTPPSAAAPKNFLRARLETMLINTVLDHPKIARRRSRLAAGQSLVES